MVVYPPLLPMVVYQLPNHGPKVGIQPPYHGPKVGIRLPTMVVYTASLPWWYTPPPYHIHPVPPWVYPVHTLLYATVSARTAVQDDEALGSD